MNDPKILQIIAEKACQFDRAHFDDDVPVADESLLSYHERLPADRKLITRLRPRYAVALGFFEGYTKATEDLASKSTSQTNIGIVIKPPPPPPPAAPPAPNELRTEIDDELAHAAAEYANNEEGFPTTARDIDEVRDAMKAGKGWHAVVRSFVHGAQWQLSRIENAHAGDDPTMHFHPAFDRAPMPSDREIVELVYRRIYPDVRHPESAVKYVVDVLNDDPENIRRKIGMYSGSTAEACAIKFALLHFRDRLAGSANEVQNAERTQYETTIQQKNERIAELEEQLEDEIENMNKTSRENVKLTNDASELRASIFGYFQTEHRSDLTSLAARNHLRLLVGLPLLRSATPVSGTPGSGELYVENGNVMFRNASGDESVVAASEPEQYTPDPIVFRDLVEACFWDKHTHVLASKPNTTSQSVATGADEMVEERRKRLPKEDAGSDWLMPKEDADSDWLIEFAKRTGSESLAMTPEQMWTDVVALIPESTTPSQVRTMLDRAWRLSASVPRRASEMSKARGDGAIVEVTDELLLEAARFANKENDDPEHESDVASARESIALSATDAWSVLVRGYVNGAQRSSREL